MIALDALADLEARWNDRDAEPLTESERAQLVALSAAVRT